MKKVLIVTLSVSLFFSCMGSGSFAKQNKTVKKPVTKIKTVQKAKPAMTIGISKPLSDKIIPLNSLEQKPMVEGVGSGATISEPITTKTNVSVGVRAGSSAGLTGAVGDVSYSLQNLIPGAAIRGSVGYLTGSGTTVSDNLKMATVNLDAIYSLNEQKASTPLNVYVGGGLVLPWKVNNGRGAGAWGAHAYIGSKYNIQDNYSIYGELAYTGIKYDSSEKALRGVEAMMGYSYSF